MANSGRRESATTASTTAVRGRHPGRGRAEWRASRPRCRHPCRPGWHDDRARLRAANGRDRYPEAGATRNVTATRTVRPARPRPPHPARTAPTAGRRGGGTRSRATGRAVGHDVGRLAHPDHRRHRADAGGADGRAGVTGASSGSSPPTASSRPRPARPRRRPAAAPACPGFRPTRSPCSGRPARRSRPRPGPSAPPGAGRRRTGHQSAFGIAPRRPRRGHGQAGRPAPRISAGGQHEPVAGRARLGSFDRRVDQSWFGAGVGRLLAGHRPRGIGWRGQRSGQRFGQRWVTRPAGSGRAGEFIDASPRLAWSPVALRLVRLEVL